MAWQPIPVIDAVQDREMEKIILSGSPHVSSILGPNAYRITAPAIPVYYGSPIITGLTMWGSVLTCSEGAFHSSPRAVATYQWKKDTVNIAAETSSTYTTVLGDVGSSITCEVTATNASGVDTDLSNALVVTTLVPGDVFEFGAYVIQGLDCLGRLDVNDSDVCIITGISHIDKIDCNMGEVEVITGFVHPDKIDVDVADVLVVTGAGSDLKLDINIGETHVITGVGSDDKLDVLVGDAYAVFLPEVLTPLVVLNGDAENSLMTDWTMVSGNVQSVTTAAGGDITVNREGLRFFKADDLGQGVNSKMKQQISIPAGDYTDVDTGRCYTVTRFIHQSEEDVDLIDIEMRALDAGLSTLATEIFAVPSNPDGQGWLRSVTDVPLSLPTLTRVVEITIHFKAQGTGSVGNNGYIDDLEIELLKSP